MNIYNDFSRLLQDFESLPTKTNSESIFDIAGYPHYENVASNVLAFYLNPNNEHGLGHLVLSSLLSLIGKDKAPSGHLQVNREVSTIKGGRLDITIETDNQIIGIENKLFHHLNNDLEDYSISIDEWARRHQLDTIKVILSIKNEPVSFGFVNITYRELWPKVRENLGSHLTTSSQKWALYLIDFITTIEKLYGKNMEIDEYDKFFIEHEERINTLINERNKFISKLHRKVRDLADLVEKPDDCTRQWIHAKSCLVHDYEFSENRIALDLYITPKGWTLEIFGRNTSSTEHLNKLLSMPAFSNHSQPDNTSRVTLVKFDLSTELTSIKDETLKWLRLLSQAEKERKQAP